MIREASKSDARYITAIYNHYIAKTIITFEENPVDADDIAARIQETQDGQLPYLVYENTNGEIGGYAYASKWKGRCAYRHSVEITIYLDIKEKRSGVGTKLYEELFARLIQLNYHVVIAGISLPNIASIALHEKFGLTKCAHFEEVGFKFGSWVDVGYWQRTIG